MNVQRLILAGSAALFVAGGVLAGPLAGIAGATDVNVGVLSTCDAGGKWQLQFQVQSLYDQPLEVVLLDSHGPVDLNVAPNGSAHVHESPDADTFVYHWTAPVAHLHGDGVLGPVTLHRPGGCVPATTSTVPGSTTTTTCDRAIPPRDDCATPTTPAPTTPATVPPTAAPTTTVAPPASSEAPPVSSSLAPPGPTSIPSSSVPATTPLPTKLPATGAASDALILLAGCIIGAGIALTIAAMRRRGQ